MWAQSWGNLFEMLAPYPDATKVDLTQILKDKNFTVDKIFRVINFFFNLNVYFVNKYFNFPYHLNRLRKTFSRQWDYTK